MQQYTPDLLLSWLGIGCAAYAQHTRYKTRFLTVHSHTFLTECCVFVCAQVNIIITQAVGVAANQQPFLLADKLHQLSSSPALAQLLSLSGLTLAQAGKPQVIDLSAAAAAAGLSRGSTLAAASALGSEAAALGHAWGTIGSGNGSSSSGGSSTAAPQKQGEGSVATPAVIGVAVAVAVSVVAVCAAAVAIVVVKQRAKQARAAAAEDQQQLPKSSKVSMGEGCWVAASRCNGHISSHQHHSLLHAY